MLLVFGGTTEGRKAVEVLEEAGKTYFYSTKTGEQELTLHHGLRIDGALDAEAMCTFCRDHDIRLIIDAAHPFAATLHATIQEVAAAQDIPVVRYERIYPPRDPDITWIDDYTQVPTDISSLLATTGVQSISKLKWLEGKGIRVFYRILNRESSIALAKAQGAEDDQLCYYTEADEIGVEADAILLKESGESGGFTEKVKAARDRGMRVIAIKRPLAMDNRLSIVNGPYGLRRAVERLLPEFFPLHSGLTTGTCATAAAVAAMLRLTKGETPEEVPVVLPNGETITVPVGYGDGYAYCIKEAGDDPDVTNGIEVRAEAGAERRPTPDLARPQQRSSASVTQDGLTFSQPVDSFATRGGRGDLEGSGSIVILGGEGVGRFTLPGFDYPPGEAAINKGPREMIRRNLQRIVMANNQWPTANGQQPTANSQQPTANSQWTVTISVPEGAAIARRTFNPRLGIEGGISIIGVSGIVKPFSEEAFIESIRKCMTVAKASGAERVVINSGAKSEGFLKARYADLPRQAFVEYGNYIGETLKIANELGFKRVTLGVMLGKAVKLAAGNLDTHSKKVVMDKAFIAELLREAGCAEDAVEAVLSPSFTLARELWHLLPAALLPRFADIVIRRCYAHCHPLLPDGQLTILLMDDDGRIYE